MRTNSELDREGLVRDRKVKQGVNTRTYKVSFAKIRNTFPGFKCDWTVALGVKNMVEDFQARKLTADQFKNRNFYRLQKIESLYQDHHLSDDLRWTKPESERQ